MSTDRLLTELDRQAEHLGRLPGEFEFRLFDTAQAIRSQRASGYRNTAAAAREIVDNAIEAGAQHVWITIDESKHQNNRRYASAVAFIDDGPGMLPEMARYALTWGGGTHADEARFIGKFGFGLPNSSVNQTERVEVYTRTTSDEPIRRVDIDIREVTAFGKQTVAPAEEADLPDFVKRYLRKNDVTFDHGTVVVWCRPDRLTYRTPAKLREHLIDDFGVVYRYLLDDVTILVEHKRVEVVDPLFLDPRGRFFLSGEDGGAQEIEDRLLPVRSVEDPDSGERRLELVDSPEQLETSSKGTVVAAGSIRVRVARFPLDFVEFSKGKATTDAHQRAKIRRDRRGISFVRAQREIETVDSFPRSEEAKASGLGDWPLLQAFAYHFAVEISFKPELDDVMGIANDKQAVRPSEDFWRVLASAEVDRIIREEQNWQRKERRRRNEERATDEIGSDGPTPGEQAARDADRFTGRPASLPDDLRDEARVALEARAEEEANLSGTGVDDALQALLEDAERRPYKIEFATVPHGPFYVPKWVGSQLVVTINQAHPFYSDLYVKLLRGPWARRAKEATDLLLITLAKAEKTAEHKDTRHFYEAQREQHWSTFLATALKGLRELIDDTDAEYLDEELALGESQAA